MNPRKHPRTLQEAFGPYCSPMIQEDPPYDWQDKLILWSAVLGMISVALLVLL